MTILDINEAAQYLKMCRRSLDNLVRQGKIPAVRLVNKWIFSKEQLQEYVETLSKENAKTLGSRTESLPPQKTRRRNRGYGNLI